MTRAAVWRRYKERHPDRLAASQRRYRETHQDALRAKERMYRERNRERLRAYDRLRYERDRVARAAYGKRHYLASRPERACRGCGAPLPKIGRFQYCSPECRRISQRPALLERERRYARASYARDPTPWKEGARRRKLRLRRALGSHTTAEWREKVALFGDCCAYCGEARPLTRDHKLPLIRGGTDDVANIVPACSPCNARKRARTANEFLRSIRDILPRR